MVKRTKGVEHNLTFELLFKITNVNSTVVINQNLFRQERRKSVQK